MLVRTSWLRPLALAALLATAGASQAALTVYTDQASFLAAVGLSGTDTFNDLTPGADLGSGPVARSAGSFGYSVSEGPTSTFLFGAGSEGDAWLTTQYRKDTITFNGFSAGTSAAGGFFFATGDDGQWASAGLVVVSATDASGATSQQYKLRAGQDSFFGFVSDGELSSLTVRVVGTKRNALYPTVNDLTLASAVPEPGTYALLLAGLGVVGCAARRRRSS